MMILSCIANTTLLITPFILILLLLTPLIDKKYAAKGRYFLWIAIMIGLCLPFINILRPIFQIDIALPASFQMQADLPIYNDFIGTADNTEPVISTYTPTDHSDSVPMLRESIPDESRGSSHTKPAIDTPSLLLLIYVLGIFLSFIYHGFAYLRFRKFIQRWSITEANPDIMKTYHDEALFMNVRKNVPLMRCKSIKTPVLTGYFKPSILLPDHDYGRDELMFIFRHEFTHYKRLDLWYKLALVIIRSVYWFNPAVHLMAVQANKDIETICDMEVVQNSDTGIKKKYSEVILSMAVVPNNFSSHLTTSFTGGKKLLKQRITNIFKSNKKSGIALFSVLGIVVIAISVMVGFHFVSNEPLDDINNPLSASAEVPDDLQTDYLPSSTEAQANTSAEFLGDTQDPLTTSDESLAMNTSNQNNMWERESYDNLDELIALVYDEAELIVHEFENISSINISSVLYDFHITQGGDKLIVRYHEWIEDTYEFNISNGRLYMNDRIPYHNYNIEDNYSTINGSNAEWLRKHLHAQGKRLAPVEIIIPASMSFDSIYGEISSGTVKMDECDISTINFDISAGALYLSNSQISRSSEINVGAGDLLLNHCKFDRIQINAAAGNATIENCEFDSMDVNIAAGDGSIMLPKKADEYDITLISSLSNITYNGETIRDHELQNQNATSKITVNASVSNMNISD